MKFTWLKNWNVVPLAILIAGAVASAPVFAQSQSGQGTQGSGSNPDKIQDRKENQQDRIAQGVKSGQLTAHETGNLENKEANLNQETRDDRQANGGKLTSGEKQQINRQQNNLSKQIYDDKHNGQTAHYGNNEVGQRRENQQDRIAQGIKSGKMSARQTANIENKESAVNHEIKNDRQANGGKLTSGEKAKVNQQQNKMSGQIYRDKHSGTKAKQ